MVDPQRAPLPQKSATLPLVFILPGLRRSARPEVLGMKWVALVVLVISAAGGFAQQDDAAPQLLVDAAQCVVSSKDDWAGISQHKLTELEMGMAVDRKPYSGGEFLYVVNYNDAMHTSGTVLAFISEGRDPHRVLRFQYKVDFRQPEDGSRALELIDMPYGGIGTRNRILNTINNIGFGTYKISKADFDARPAAACESDEQAN